MFPTDLIMCSSVCVVFVMSGQTKGWRAGGEREEQNLFILLFVSDECRHSRRAGARGPRSRPGADRRPDTAAASSAPFVHPNSSSSRAPLLRSLSASPILSWAKRTNAASLLPLQSSTFSSAAAEIITVRSRHTYADGLAWTALEHLVYSVPRTPFLSSRLTLRGHCKCVDREAGISRIIFLSYLKGKSNKTSQHISVAKPGSRLVHSMFCKVFKGSALKCLL